MIEDVSGQIAQLWAAIGDLQRADLADPVNFSSSLVWSSAGTQPALGNGAQEAQYKILGNKYCHYEGAFFFGTTTTAGTGNYTINLPFAAHQSGIGGTNTPWIGTCKFFINTTGFDYPGVMQIFGGTNVNFPIEQQSGVPAYWSPTIPSAPSNGRNFVWTILYRIA
jgi:hypothetical protein